MAGQATMLEKMMWEVMRFHKEVTGTPFPERPTMLKGDRKQYAYDHLQEELDEFTTATTVEDQADAIVDMIYVAIGRLYEMGYLPGPTFDVVHQANMKRSAGTNAKRGHAKHDAVKPPGWMPPDIRALNSITLDDLFALLRSKRVIADKVDTAPTKVVVSQVLAPPTAAAAKPFDQTKKDVAGKAPLWCIPIEGDIAAAWVFDYGAWKYSWDGYKKSPPSYTELVSALIRHARKFANGQDLDLDDANTPVEPKTSREYSGLNHVGHMLCCAHMLAWVIKNRPDRDDRPGRVPLPVPSLDGGAK